MKLVIMIMQDQGLVLLLIFLLAAAGDGVMHAKHICVTVINCAGGWEIVVRM